ncbi:MAG: hypothetical protein H7222_10165 [Methylotenera sp.]|nr:hypothetical protein [Oligoflexia bacterium]
MKSNALLIITAVVCAGVSQTACIPTHGTVSTVRTKTKATSSVGTSSSEADGALGVCKSIDITSPDRKYCTDCYSELLASKCPSTASHVVTSSDDCRDLAIKAAFSNIVNQCLAAKIQSGGACPATTCSAGKVFNAAACSCTTPTTGSGGSTPTVDSGQVDYGPPIVSLYVPETSSAPTADGTSLDPTCTIAAVNPRFYVRNRGDTVARFNVYHLESTGPAYCSDDATANRVNSVDGAAAGGAGTVKSSVVSSPRFPLYTNSGVLQSAFSLTTATEMLASGEDEADYTGLQSIATNPLTAGTYELSIDLKLFNDWNGDNDGILAKDHFQVKINTNVIFKQSFSNDKTSPTATVYGQSYSPRADAAHQTMVTDPLDPANGTPISNAYLDSHYVLQMTFTLATSTPPGGLNLEIGSPTGKSYHAWTRIKRIQTCGIKYSFTDSNQQKSNYCYRFTPRTLKTLSAGAGPGATATYSCYAVPVPQNYWTGAGENETCF